METPIERAKNSIRIFVPARFRGARSRAANSNKCEAAEARVPGTNISQWCLRSTSWVCLTTHCFLKVEIPPTTFPPTVFQEN